MMGKLRHFNFGLRAIRPLLLLTSLGVLAQTPIRLPPGTTIQFQVAQQPVDVSSPVTATAGFDRPVVSVGDKIVYRVNVSATESSILWPDALPAAEELKIGASTRGQITQTQANSFRPLTSFIYEITATAAGHFTITNFTIDVSGVTVEVPAASLNVVAEKMAAPPARRLRLEISVTNVFLGQPFRVRVILPAGPENQIEALREIQFHGDGLMIDKTASRQSVEPVNLGNELRMGFVSEMVVTPITPGLLTFSAQGFTAGSEFTPPISFHGQMSLPSGPPNYILLVSDPMEIKVRPLPVEGELPGFTGAIGKFYRDPPILATNRLRVGEPVSLKLAFHGENELSRLASPVAPRSRDWEIIADPLPGTGFTLIPLTDDVHETPAIPFSYFDPELAKYVSLTVPPMPVTVIGDGLPVELSASDETGKSPAALKLSPLALTPGKVVGSLKPLQLRGWFVGLQLVPVLGLVALWQWDRRRRYLEAHPEIGRRARARRALRRERKAVQQAVAAGDTAAFIHHATSAMSIAVAPHFPANPRALVSGDVLAQLDENSRPAEAGEIVKIVFAAADAQFSGTPATPPELRTLAPGVETILQILEEKL